MVEIAVLNKNFSRFPQGPPGPAGPVGLPGKPGPPVSTKYRARGRERAMSWMTSRETKGSQFLDPSHFFVVLTILIPFWFKIRTLMLLFLAELFSQKSLDKDIDGFHMVRGDEHSV